MPHPILPTLRAQRNHFTGRESGKFSERDYRALTLLPLSEEQIRSYLRAALPDMNVDSVIGFVRSVHNLSELAQRPYSLRVITEQIPALERIRAAGRAVHGVTLYELMVEQWLDRDDGKHRIRRQHKLELMGHLAAYLWREGLSGLPAAQLQDWFQEWRESAPRLRGAYASVSSEQLEEDLRTATFLARVDDRKGSSYRFAHTSLQEYFLARALLKAVERDRCQLWSMRLSSRETLEFFTQLLAERDDPALLATLGRWRHHQDVEVTELLLHITLIAHAANLPAPRLDGIRLEGAQLDDLIIDGRGASRTRLSLAGANFRHASLRRAQIGRVDLSGATFNNACLDQASYVDATLPRATWREASTFGTTWWVPKLSAVTSTLPLLWTPGHTGSVWAWRSARTAPAWPAPAATARCGCGTRPPEQPSRPSPATPARFRRGVQPGRHPPGQRRRRRHGAAVGSGHRQRPSQHPHRPHRRGSGGGVQPGRHPPGQRQRRRHGAAVGPGHRHSRRHDPSPATPTGCRAVAFSPDGTPPGQRRRRRHGAAVGPGHRQRPSQHPHRPHRPGVGRWRSARTARRLATAGDDGTVRLWDPATGTAVHDPHRPHRRGVGRGVQPGRHAASPPPAATARCGCGTRPPAQPSHALTGHTDWVTGVAFSPDGTRAGHRRRRRHGAAVGRGHRPSRRTPLTGHTGSVSARGVQPGRHAPGHRAATTARCGCGTRPPATAVRDPHRPHRRGVGAVAFSPDGTPPGHRQRRRHGAAVGPGHRHRPSTTLHRPHRPRSQRVAFSPDGTPPGHRRRRRHGRGCGIRATGTDRPRPCTGHTGAV